MTANRQLSENNANIDIIHNNIAQKSSNLASQGLYFKKV